MQPIFRVRYTRNGGLRFLRIGRFQFSFCLCRQGPETPSWHMPAILDLNAFPRGFYHI